MQIIWTKYIWDHYTNTFGVFLLLSMLQAMSKTVWFLRFMTPFCCGEYGTVKWRRIPCSSQKGLNTTEINSPPQSSIKVMKATLLPNKKFKVLKNCKSLWFFFQEINSDFTRKIINKSYETPVLTNWARLEQPTNINMYQIKRLILPNTPPFSKNYSACQSHTLYKICQENQLMAILALIFY